MVFGRREQQVLMHLPVDRVGDTQATMAAVIRPMKTYDSVTFSAAACSERVPNPRRALSCFLVEPVKSSCCAGSNFLTQSFLIWLSVNVETREAATVMPVIYSS